MSYRRTRPGRSAALPSNVIELNVERQRRSLAHTPSIFYLTSYGQWLPNLEQFAPSKVIAINSEESLCESLLLHRPNLFVLESDLTWCCPILLTKRLQALISSPVTMLCDPDFLKEDPGFLKQAFQAGVSDTLFTPLDPEEVTKTFDVLLKLQSALA